MEKRDELKSPQASRGSLILSYLGILIVSLLFFAVIARITSFAISKRLRSNSCEQYQLLADNTAERINSWLSTKKEIIENQRASIETIDDFSPEYLSLFLARAISERNDYDEICDLYFVGTDGVLTTALGYYTDYDLRTREYYQSCLGTREIQYTSTYRDLSTGSYIMTISAGCQDRNGDFTGIIALDIYVDAFLQEVNDAQVPENSYMFLIDSDFGVASHPYEAYGFIDELPQHISELPGNIYSDLVQTIRTGEYSMTAISDYDGELRDMFVSRIDSCGWFVVAAVSDYVLKSPERIMTGFIVAALFICIFLGVIWTLIVTSRMMKQLREARDTANAANETKSIFLASMSHEIRTPINAVLGMNEMIMKESRKVRKAEHIDPVRNLEAWKEIGVYSENIKHAGDNLLAIINGILDFSKIEAGRMEIVNGEYSLGALLNDVYNMFLFRADGKGIGFIVEVDETIPDRLFGDEVRIRQVMTNLLSNAVKYTDAGSVKFGVHRVDDAPISAGELITLDIVVSDTGIGIKKEDIDKLFTKFERVDLDKNSSVEGTGLGLPITRDLLTLMGGQIGVESTYGTGSKFTVYLPQKVISAEPVGDFRGRFTEDTYEEGADGELFHAPQAGILVVDDTRMNLTVISGLLKPTGIMIDTAESGAEAIELSEKKKYDLILMDQRMPEMDGTEAMRRIRNDDNGKNRDTGIICLTADAVNGAREKYIGRGFTDYLTKPVDGTLLERMILKYLPEDKISAEAQTEKREEREDDMAGNDLEILAQAGIDTDTGLKYSGNDMELYHEVLLTYGQESKEKREKLVRFFEAKDWEGYSILIHSVKSASRSIGAGELSDIASRLERASAEGDGELVLREHDEMLKMFDSVAETVISVCGTGQESGDDEIFEFTADPGE